ncbi:unnamed protein product [Pleuronectes platessa]|uniref:Uncharacterized protein n=1 Tax=Pleuronectes platessa TaxID=8262 RepID=A0A9N7TWF6_PLEPL|nr:unnamed protein product [Pleuronectes platessa]
MKASKAALGQWEGAYFRRRYKGEQVSFQKAQTTRGSHSDYMARPLGSTSAKLRGLYTEALETEQSKSPAHTFQEKQRVPRKHNVIQDIAASETSDESFGRASENETRRRESDTEAGAEKSEAI